MEAKISQIDGYLTPKERNYEPLNTDMKEIVAGLLLQAIANPQNWPNEKPEDVVEKAGVFTHDITLAAIDMLADEIISLGDNCETLTIGEIISLPSSSPLISFPEA